MAKISKYFSAEEFRCPETHILFVDPELLLMLDALREAIGHALYVTSGCRSEEYNAKIGGAERSRHITKRTQPCTAVDIKCRSSAMRYQLIQLAMELGFGGIGVYKHHVHLDNRETPTMWWG